ncbi:MAG TPA: esterase family protein [Candidatus Janibacter merdipullorum]|nr:esterase family protein [Candidatus Janibacter merdipullorum]
MSQHAGLSRRTIIRGGAGLAVAGAAVGLGATPAGAATNGHGLTIADTNEHKNPGRLRYYKFRTAAIGGLTPGVNVLLPDGYETSGKRYPVMYLLHGGVQNFTKFHLEDDIIGATAHKDLIVVMPDGGIAGWYSNPVSSQVGKRDWETFHISQLIPWIDANFRTYAEYNGRAVSGFSMGGFGALKYAAKYYGHFASVSSHSGPASLRRDSGIVAHWANLSSAVAELGGGTLYGVPGWNQAKVTADNPVERIESYRNKRVFLAAGLNPDALHFPGFTIPGANPTEAHVLAGQREFRAALDRAGIRHESHELAGGHFVRPSMLRADIDGAIGRLRKA